MDTSFAAFTRPAGQASPQAAEKEQVALPPTQISWNFSGAHLARDLARDPGVSRLREKSGSSFEWLWSTGRTNPANVGRIFRPTLGVRAYVERGELSTRCRVWVSSVAGNVENSCLDVVSLLRLRLRLRGRGPDAMRRIASGLGKSSLRPQSEPNSWNIVHIRVLSAHFRRNTADRTACRPRTTSGVDILQRVPPAHPKASAQIRPRLAEVREQSWPRQAILDPRVRPVLGNLGPHPADVVRTSAARGRIWASAAQLCHNDVVDLLLGVSGGDSSIGAV